MVSRNLAGPKVRDARRRLKPKLTQAELAARMQVAGYHVDRAAIAKIESGLREITDRELVALAAALGVSAGWLVGERSAPDE
jgi:HTH-type transcriptional regulator, cell division transcriptional repressor